MSGSIIICPAEAVPSGILYSGSTWNTALEFSQRWLGAKCRLSPAKLANSMIIFKNNFYHIEIARDSGGNTLTRHKYPEFQSGKSVRTGICTIVRVKKLNLHIALMNCVFLTVISSLICHF